MSIKRKIAGAIVKKVPLDINGVLDKVGQAVGQKTATDYIAELQEPYFIIQTKSTSVSNVLGTIIEEEELENKPSYQIFDENGVVQYHSDAKDTLTNRDILVLYDENGNKIGKIKEHLVSMGKPVIEKDTKKCSIYLEQEKIAQVKKYLSLNGLNMSVSAASYRITHRGFRFQIFEDDHLLATLYDCALNFKEGFVDKYVMSYDPMEKSKAVLFAIAIDVLMLR